MNGAALPEVMDQLAELLAAETQLVTAGRVTEIAPMQSEKLRLARLYEQAFRAFDPSNAPASPRTPALSVAAARLARAATENERALRIGGAATRHLIEMLVDSIKSQQGAVRGYGATRAPSRPAPMRPVAVNRRA
jgi:hypothetical protein